VLHHHRRKLLLHGLNIHNLEYILVEFNLNPSRTL
jgi:hypothetical protein